MEELVPVSDAIEDSRVNTQMEIAMVKQFLKNGEIKDTFKTSRSELLSKLKSIGYRSEDHKKYQFFFGKNSEGYGHDFRHIYIKPLNDGFSYI